MSRCGPLALTLVLVGAVLAGGCSSDPALHVDLGAHTVDFDDDHGVVVTGARPGYSVTVVATTRDYEGATWTSRTTFLADSHGRVDTASQAPASGDYTGVHATGLVFSMTSSSPHAAFDTTKGLLSLTVTATQSGRSGTTGRQQRAFLEPGIRVRDTSLTDDGIVGTLYLPATVEARAAAVLVFGGSEGGDALPRFEAAALAAHGHPALALAYFGAPGLPATLTNIPLEYFGTALHWLAAQPGLAGHPLVVKGTSRGSEAALLTAVHFPTLVSGVIAASPTSFANVSFPDTRHAAWTWHGQEVPYAAASASYQVTQGNPAADIPVGAIKAPVLLLCGEDDELWPSCGSAQRIVQESPGLPRTVVAEPGAGHGVGFPVPDLPMASGEVDEGDRILETGGTVEADALGRLDAWPKLLAWLDHVSTASG